jgi:hypothetical protein
MTKTFWTCEQDFALALAIQVHDQDWHRVARWLELGKSPKQCRERWENHLDPAIVHTAWADDDVLTLLVHHAICGSRWSAIARQMPGFSANGVKNKYMAVRRSLSADCRDPVGTLLAYHYMIRW